MKASAVVDEVSQVLS